MLECPKCHKAAFDRQLRACTACGWAPPPKPSGAPKAARVVSGTPQPLPMDALQPVDEAPAPLPMDALQPVQDDDIPMMPGFEPTMLVPDEPPPPKKEPEVKKAIDLGFQYQHCPGCQAATPVPNPKFCDACGTRLQSSRKKKAPGAELSDQRCTDCGALNGGERSRCVACGSKLPTLED